jgi:hypothetical protein
MPSWASSPLPARVTVRRWVLLAFAVLGALGWGWGIWQSHEGNTASQAAKSSSATAASLAAELITKDNQIKRIITEHSDTLTEVKTLSQQVEELVYVVANVDLKLPAADQYLGELAANLVTDINRLCQHDGVQCVGLPAPASPATPTTSAATTTPVPVTHSPAPVAVTTTTTAPKHGHGKGHG